MEPIKRMYRRIFRDVAPAKDTLTEMTEEEPKSVEEMRRRLAKK